MAYSRIEYLQSLNRMRNSYQTTGGNSGINTTDDSTNVGNELSSFAYMDTDIPAPKQASVNVNEPERVREATDFDKVIDTISEVETNIDKGVLNFFDMIGDFVMTVAGALSGVGSGIVSAIKGEGFESGWEAGTQWAETAIEYDWVSQAQNFINNTRFNLTKVLDVAGDIYQYGGNVGEVWKKDWTSLSSSEQSSQRIKERVEDTGYISDEANRWINFGGELLPSIVLTVVTFGASSAGTISSLTASLINAGVAGATTMGASMENSIKESGNFGGAELGYSALKGGISFGLSMGSSALGGQINQTEGVVSKVSTNIAKNFGSSTARAIVKDTSEILIRTGIQTTEAGLNYIIDPALKTITYDKEALSQYTTPEYWDKFGKTLTETAIISGLANTAVKGGQIAKEGGWKNHIDNLDYKILATATEKYDALRQNMYSELESSKTPYEAKVIMEKYRVQMDKLGKQVSKVMETANEKYSVTINKGENFVMKSDYTSGQFKQKLDEKTMNYEMYKTAKVLVETKFKEQFNKMSEYTNGNMRFESSNIKGDFVDVDTNGNTTFGTNQSGKTLKLPMIVDNKGKINLEIENKSDVSNALIVFGSSKNTSLSNSMKIGTDSLNIPKVNSNVIKNNSNVIITKEVSSKLLSKSNYNEIKKFLTKGIEKENTDNYVVQLDNKSVVVEPFNDNGVQKYGLITIDSKTNQVLDINVKTSRPSFDKAMIVPKKDETKLLETKLEGKDGTANVYAVSEVDYDWDITNNTNEHSINAKPTDRYDPNGGFIYSKNPIAVKEFSKKIPFSKLTKTFGISKSLEKTYNLKLKDSKNEFSVLKWVGKLSGLTTEQVLDKLGYDAIVKNDGSVTFFNGGNIIDRGVKYKYGKTSDNYSKIIKRNVSDNSIQRLQEYVSKNGKGIETANDQKEYAKLVRENFAYHEVTIKYSGEKVSGVKIINKEAYAPIMKHIVEYNSKIGIKTSFALRFFDDYKGDIDVAGFYSPIKKQIILFVDTVGYGGSQDNLLAQVNAHEIFHALSDKLHAQTILSDLKGLPEYPNKKEWNNLVKNYAKVWDFKNKDVLDVNVSAEEELLANIFAGSQKMSDQNWVDEFREKTLEIYNGGTKVANRQFYEILGKEEAEMYEMQYDRAEPEAKKTTIGLAVTYDEPITSETFETQIAKYKPKVEKRIGQLANAFGIKYTIGEAIGGWTFTDKGSGKVMIGGEPSFPIAVTHYKDLNDVNLIASILADTSYEVQNSVGVIEYDENGSDVEDTFYLTRVDDRLNDVIKSSNLEGYTLLKDEKKLVVVGAKDDIIDTLLTELENGGYLNGEKHQATKCNANWLGIKERADLYKARLENGMGQENWLINRYVTKAIKINKYMLEHLAKDEEGNYYRIKGTENNASKILKLLDNKETNNRPTYKELIKNSANLKHTKVYDVKTTEQIVENALTNMLDKFNNAIKISIPTGKGNLKNFTFEELNLAKDTDLAVQNIVKQIESAVVTFDNGVNGHEKVELSKLGYTEDLTKAIKGLLEHKGELSAKSKWVQKYMNTLRRYANYVHERAQLTSEYITAIKAQKTLTKYFEDTTKMKIGGNIVVDEINLYKKLISGFLLTKSGKNIAPSTFTKFVNNYNELTSTFEGYKDPIIGAHIENLKSSFVDGKFPDREPTLSEMQDFNMARARILARARELVSEKHMQKVKSVEKSVKLASVALKAEKPNRYGKISQTIDSVVSLPVMVRGWFGYDNKITDAFNHDYLLSSSKYYGIAHSYTKLVFETLAKEAGFKNTSALTKDFSKKLPVQFNDRNGKPMKITNGQAFTAYLYYLTEHDQLVNTGAEIKDRKNQTLADFKFKEEDYEKMFEAMSPTTKKYADIIFKKFMNGKLRDDRNELYKEFYGVDNVFTSDTYARVYRIGQTNSGVANTDFHSGVLNIFKQAFTKERVNSKNHFLIKDGVEYLSNVIEEQARWSTAQYVSEINGLLNTPIDGHTLEYFMKTNIPQWEKTWSPIMSKLVLGKPVVDEKNGLLSITTRAGITATLGFNPSTMLKQMLSDPAFMLDEKVTARLWLKTLPKGFVNIFKSRSITKTLEENNGYFIERFENNDVIKSYLGGKKPNILQKIFFWGMEKMDKTVITGHGYAIAQEYVKQEIKKGHYNFSVGSAEYNKEVAHILHGLTLLTQSNSDPMFMSRLRSGDAGYIEKNVFGLFASDSQDKIQALRELTKEKLNSSKRAKAYKEASEDESRSEEDREFFKQEYEKENYHYKKMYGKKIGGFLATILIGGIGTVAINDFMKKLKGKKSWNDFNTQELLTDVFLESTVNWLPYVGTIANAIENNSDVSAFTVDKLNNLVDTVKLVVSAFETKDENTIKKAIVNLIQNGLQLSGIPAKNIYEIVMGIWYQIDKEGSLTAQSWVKGYSSSYMKSQYTEYIKNGDYTRARAQLGSWASMYSVDLNDEEVLDEIVRLAKEGYNATPSVNATSYTNDAGETVHFTEAQATAFSTEYNKSTKQLSELLKIDDYKKADDDTKAKMISKMYSLYKESAKAKATGISPSSKLAQLLYYTNGDVDMAKYIAYLQRLSNVKEDDKHTRKENVVAEINKIKGLNKQEKLLLAYLSGYSVSDSNKTALISFLMKNGMKKKEAEELLK